MIKRVYVSLWAVVIIGLSVIIYLAATNPYV
jgi:hypothetical protein